MSNINELILESHKPTDNDLPTRGDVGAGYGKYVGSTIAGPVGYPLGYYVGKHHIMEHPQKSMNKNSAGHRFGAMLNNSSKLKNIGIKIAGTAIGASLGGKVGKHMSLNSSKSHVHSATGSLIGAAIGNQIAQHVFGDGKENRHLAKKLGYGTFGRTAASFTPFAGLFKPKKQQEEDQDNK